MEFFIKVGLHYPLKTDLYKVCGNVQNIDGVRKIAKNVYKGFSHFTSHS